MTENLFGFLYVLPLVLWISMLLFPRASFTRQMVTSNWPFLALAAIHLLLLLAALGTVSPAQIGISAEAMRATLLSDWGFLALWAHLLTLNLFVGVWIFRDTRYWRIQPAPYLIAAHFAGPLGLGLYLWVRSRREPGDPVRNLN